MPEYELRLAKEDFKFAVAHFTLFADGRAELLHGHNYHVSVSVVGETLGEDGLLLDVAELKTTIRAKCAELDERVLLPRDATGVCIERDGKQTKVRVGERGYSIPSEDVVELPIGNVCIELLARYFWDHLAPTLDRARIRSLTVEVQETDGQSCAFRSAL